MLVLCCRTDLQGRFLKRSGQPNQRIDVTASFTEALRLVRQNDYRIILVDPTCVTHAQMQELASSTQGTSAMFSMRVDDVEADERFKTFMDNLPAMAFIKDAAGRYVYVNEPLVQIVRRPVHEIIGATDADLMPPHMVDLCVASDHRAMQTHGTYQQIEPFPDGDDFSYYAVTKFPIQYGGTRFLGGIAMDITSQKSFEAALQHTKQELQQQETRLRLAVDAAELGTWEWNLQNGAVIGDKRFYRHLGHIPNRPMTIETFYEYISPADRELVRTSFTTCAQSPTPILGCAEFRTREMSRWLSCRIRSIATKNGKPTAIVGTTLDITARKQVEAEMSAARATAEAASQSKSASLAHMTHEIRTPLNAILGFAELLDDPKVDEQERRTYLDIIRRNGRELARLVDDILDLSKIEAGHLDLNFTSVSLSDLLVDIEASLSQMARSKKLQLVFRQEGEITDKVITDRARLRQILMNVVGNALKYTRVGKVEVTLEQPEPELLKFTVQDTGIGIASDDHAKIFRPYSQPTCAAGSTGLGLSLARQLARALGGDVTLVASEPEVGSTFSVTIRAQAAPDATGAVREAVQGASCAFKPLSGMRALVADDSMENRLLVSRILRLAGAHVDMATDGRSAVRFASKEPYDVILMDVEMPVMNGYEATHTLRRSGYSRPIIALTAHAMSEARHRCLEAGCDRHIAKPIDKDALIAVLMSYAAQRPPNRGVSEFT